MSRHTPARERLRVQLVLWLSHAHDTLADLMDQAERMRANLAGPGPSPLAEFITHEQAAGIACAIEEAISQVCTPVVPRGAEPPDPMGVVDNMRPGKGG